jgi:DNA polymerase III gamma/tau subunit
LGCNNKNKIALTEAVETQIIDYKKLKDKNIIVFLEKILEG